MRSMTGFASLEKELESANICVDIKGYNSRYLDIYTNLPIECNALESEIRLLVSKNCIRGKIELSLHVHEKNSIPLKLNHGALKTYLALAKEIVSCAESRNACLENKISIAEILRLDGVLEADRADFSSIKDEIIMLASCALERFNAEREREGAHTKSHIISLINQVEQAKNDIAASAGFVEEQIKLNIKNRFTELKIEGIDENRILTEIAFLLVKCTIAEELSRLGSHIEEFKSILDSGAAAGKKLDFLCQEISREINTIGSKTPQYEVSRLVVPAKEAVENIREQLRNVE